MTDKVWSEFYLMQNVLANINTELTQAANNAVQRLKENPDLVKELVFTEWAQDSIEKLSQAAQLEPQETSRQVEESKDESKPKLVMMVDSFIEINGAIKKKLEQELESIQVVLEKNASKIQVKNDFFNMPQAIAKVVDPNLEQMLSAKTNTLKQKLEN